MNKQNFYMLPASELLSPLRYHCQWNITRNACDVRSRRDWLDIISIELARNSKKLVDHNGQPYKLPEFDSVFDEDMRWLSHYLETDKIGLCPLRISNRIERLRIMNAVLRLRYPNTEHLLGGGQS